MGDSPLLCLIYLRLIIVQSISMVLRTGLPCIPSHFFNGSSGKDCRCLFFRQSMRHRRDSTCAAHWPRLTGTSDLYTVKPRGLRIFRVKHFFRLPKAELKHWLVDFHCCAHVPDKNSTTESFSRNMNCLCILQKLNKFIIWLRAIFDHLWLFPCKIKILLGVMVVSPSGTIPHDSHDSQDGSKPVPWNDRIRWYTTNNPLVNPLVYHGLSVILTMDIAV